MKKLLQFLLALLLSSSAIAQVEVGVTSAVLLNASTITGFNKYTPEITFSSGVIFKINKGLFMFRPGLNYLETGVGNVRPLTSTLEVVDRIKINNLELPLDVTFPVKIKKSKILFSVAPTFALAVGGRTISEVRNLTAGSQPLSTNTQNVKFGSGTNEIKRMDFGTKFGIGFEFSDGIQINAAIKTGFTNQSNINNVVFKNNHIALSASWFILR